MVLLHTQLCVYINLYFLHFQMGSRLQYRNKSRDIWSIISWYLTITQYHSSYLPYVQHPIGNICNNVFAIFATTCLQHIQHPICNICNILFERCATCYLQYVQHAICYICSIIFDTYATSYLPHPINMQATFFFTHHVQGNIEKNKILCTCIIRTLHKQQHGNQSSPIISTLVVIFFSVIKLTSWSSPVSGYNVWSI